ncbi:hypothetical protein LTR36_004359 [Oleoguttula mirabilis]|uniref:Uncharacterized protein n=1 Tax=Oleoguttula mirabilis TaxID=1507867 RepID=A0AAV9JHM0_9PEZI|nr:hypothetical protein LTR36_004359 [Oleoguttula mirabilis]
MASVQSIERQLQAEDAGDSLPSGVSEAIPGHTEQYDEDMVEVAHILTSGMTHSHLAPSDVHSLSSTETEFTERCTDDVEAVDPSGDPAMGADTEDDYNHALRGGDLQEDDHPMSLLDEARALGLCQNYFTEDPWESACLPTPPETLTADIADPPGVQSIALLVALGALNGAHTYEKWNVDKESAGFLASVLALGRDDSYPVELQDAHVTFSDLKLPEPLLLCDPELELQRLKRRNEVSISAQGVKPFPLNVDKGESFQWAPSELELLAQKDQLVALEKLEVGRNVICYLRDIANPTALSNSEMIHALVESDVVSSFHFAIRSSTTNVK